MAKKNEDNVKSSEEYLKQYLEKTDTNNMGSSPTRSDNITNNNILKSSESSRTSELKYFNFDTKDLPLGMFYPDGTKVMIRPAEVKEIQAYSMVDDNNFYDIVEKMNDMISSCVKIKYSDGTVANFTHIKDGDRFYLIFVIRELTFQKGNSLAANAICSYCNNDNSIELKKENFSFWEADEDLVPFFNKHRGLFEFSTVNGSEFNIGVPNIGLQKSFTEYIVDEYKAKKVPNMSFLKVIPFTISDRKSISEEGIRKKLSEFEIMDGDDFQFLNSAVNKMKFGIKELVTNCSSCGEEVRTDMVFPDGASGLFVVHDAFEKYIKK